MVPVGIPGHYGSNPGGDSSSVDDVLMDEGDRLKDKIEPPDAALWNRQMQMMRLFNELIAKTDRDLGNILFSRGWRLSAIDHTRAFRNTRR